MKVRVEKTYNFVDMLWHHTLPANNSVDMLWHHTLPATEWIGSKNDNQSSTKRGCRAGFRTLSSIDRGGGGGGGERVDSSLSTGGCVVGGYLTKVTSICCTYQPPRHRMLKVKISV